MRITEMRAMNMDMTDAIRNYATEKVMGLEKFAKKFDPCDVSLEIGKTSERHQKGDVFFTEITMSIPGDMIRARVVKDDLYASIDEAKDDVKRQLVDKKEKLVDARNDDDEPVFSDDSEE